MAPGPSAQGFAAAAEGTERGMIVWFRRSTPPPGETDRVSIKTRRFEQLIELAKQLDSEALGEVYQRFLPVVYGYVAARIADRRQVEDITSEVFVSMLESISRLRATDEAGFAAWILRITRFRIADHFRAQAGKVPITTAQVYPEEDEAEALLNLPSRDPADDPVLKAEVREEWARVAAAINQLTEEQRQVIIGKLILGYDNEKVARMVGKNVASVKALQHRGLQALHRLLPGVAESPARQGNRRQPPLRGKEGTQ